MTCEAARELLLTADPGELEGRTGGPLLDHLRRCSACRAAAERMLAAQRELRQVLEAIPSSRPAAEAARGAIRSAEQRQTVARRVRFGVPLAAAAVLAGVLVLRRTPAPPLTPPVRDATAVRARFSVTAPPGRNILVLQQPDTSHVIVVWFF